MLLSPYERLTGAMVNTVRDSAGSRSLLRGDSGARTGESWEKLLTAWEEYLSLREKFADEELKSAKADYLFTVSDRVSGSGGDYINPSVTDRAEIRALLDYINRMRLFHPDEKISVSV